MTPKEVKTTTQDELSMTIFQAKEAHDNTDRYALCVVHLESYNDLINTITDKNNLKESIKHNMRFVCDVGDRIK